MPTYIALVNWTDQGIKTVSAAVERADKGAEIARKHGARFLEHYWTVGPYDVVAIVEAPDDESATAVFREIGSAHAASRVRPRGDVTDHRETLILTECMSASGSTELWQNYTAASCPHSLSYIEQDTFQAVP